MNNPTALPDELFERIESSCLSNHRHGLIEAIKEDEPSRSKLLLISGDMSKPIPKITEAVIKANDATIFSDYLDSYGGMPSSLTARRRLFLECARHQAPEGVKHMTQHAGIDFDEPASIYEGQPVTLRQMMEHFASPEVKSAFLDVEHHPDM